MSEQHMEYWSNSAEKPIGHLESDNAWSQFYFLVERSLTSNSTTNLVIYFIIFNALPLWLGYRDNVSWNKWIICFSKKMNSPGKPDEFVKIIFCINIEKWNLYKVLILFTFSYRVSCPFHRNHGDNIWVIGISKWESMVIWLSRLLKKGS